MDLKLLLTGVLFFSGCIAQPGLENNLTAAMLATFPVTQGEQMKVGMTAGEILYNENRSVEVKITEIAEIEEGGEKIFMIKGNVIKGRDKIYEGMRLYLSGSAQYETLEIYVLRT